MKKIIVILSIFILLVSINHAQSKKNALGVGAEFALPQGDWGDAANNGFGGSAVFEIPLKDKITLYAKAGYLSFGGDDVDFGFGVKVSSTYAMIPIMAGAKYYINKGLYAVAEAGIHIFTVDVEYDVPANLPGASSLEDGSDSNSEFSFGGGAGYELPIGKLMLDINGRYMIVSDANYIAIRAGVKFPI